MTPPEAKATYLAYIAAENSRDRSAMEACLSPLLSVAINGVPQLADRDADAAATDRLLALYPDYRRQIVRLGTFAASTSIVVVAEWTMRGSGDAAQTPLLDLGGCTIATIERQSGRPVIVSAHLYTDVGALAHVL